MSSEERKICRSLVGSFKVRPEDQNKIRNRLNAETTAQGLKAVGLAELTGWSTSKTSKITAGKQNLDSDDIKEWARALGYTPEPFYEDGVDLQYYKLSNYVRRFDIVLEDYLETDEREDSYAAMAEYEMPLSLVLTLSLTASDYVFKTRVGGWLWNEESEGPTCIEVTARGISTGDKVVPRFGIYINEQRDAWAVVVFIDDNKGVSIDLPALRKQYKDDLGISKEETEFFEDFDIIDKSWLPEAVIHGEITSYVSNLEVIMDYKDMQHMFLSLFIHYCDLVYAMVGIRLLPQMLDNVEKYDTERNGLILSAILGGDAGGFYSDVEKDCREKNNYSCEINASHQTFIGEDDKPFMEVVPLVPLMKGTEYGTAVRSLANAVCLCPNCKAQLEYGRRDDREQLIFTLFRSHSEEMRKMGIRITLRELLEARDL